jgi:hypothetical protein
MSEREVDQRRNWKAETFPYDYFTVEPGKECQYCLTEKQAELLRGIIEPVGWRTRWWSETDQQIDPETIREFRDDLARRLMMSCCCDDQIPVQYRYSDTGVLQQSTDGGVTWNDAPEFDPRNNSPQFPPMSGADGADKRCIAATGAAALLKEQVGDQLTDDMTRYTLSQLITDWVSTMIGTSNPFQALLTVIANQIFALVIATLRPALTDPVYATFKCILYCRMSDDATFTQSKFDLVRSDITDQIGGIAGIFLEHLVYLLGVTGLENLCRAGGASTGDCSDCPDCRSCPERFEAWDLGGGISGADIIEVGDDYIICNSVGGGRQTICVSTGTADGCCTVASVEILSGGYSDFVDGVACGNAPVVGNITFHIGIPGCYNTVAMFTDSGVPFSAKITFSDGC